MYKLLIIAVFLFINNVNCQRPFYLGSGQKPTCVSQDNYCIDNTDCCSNNCTTSTNRCAATTNSSDTMPIRINDVNLQQNSSTSTLDNRFNEEGAGDCLGIDGNCKAGQECCSKTCFKSKCIRQNDDQNRVQENVQCSGINQECKSTPKGCCDFLTCESNICQDKGILIDGTETFGYKEPPYDGLNNRFGEDDNQNFTVTTAATPCMDIGEKCYKPEDCCAPLRCHSFLHQCVT